MSYYPPYKLSPSEALDVNCKLGAFSKIDGDCWIWTRSKSQGYGNIVVRGRVVRAHRASFAANNGEIPPGLVVMHSCDRKACVNPAHLSLGTQGDNLSDCQARGRSWHKRNPQAASAVGRFYANKRHSARRKVAA